MACWAWCRSRLSSTRFATRSCSADASAQLAWCSTHSAAGGAPLVDIRQETAPVGSRQEARTEPMNVRHFFAALFATAVLSVFAAEPQKISPTEAAKLVADGKAVLVDVREPAEWAENGVAKPAVL